MAEFRNHDQLAGAIVHALETEGEFVVELDPMPIQRMVDLRWAAHQAGRILGVKVRVEVGPRTLSNPVVRVRISRPARAAYGPLPARSRPHDPLRSAHHRHHR